jgi:hypothetical protein
MMSMRIQLAFAVVLFAVAPLRAQDTTAARPFDGGAFMIDLPAGAPPMRLLRMVQRGDTIAMFVAEQGDNTVMVMHRSLPEASGDTTLAARRGVLQLLYEGMLRMPDRVSVNGEPREIVTADRVTLRMPTVMRGGRVPEYGTTDLSVPRRGEAEMWMVTYASGTPAAGRDDTAVRVLDSFRLTGGSIAASEVPIDLVSGVATVAPAPVRNSTADASLRTTGRFSIVLPPGLMPPLARSLTEAERLTDTFFSGTEETTVMVMAMQPRRQPVGFSPTLANLRAIAHQTRANWLAAQRDTRITGEAREIVLPDRLTLRMPMANVSSGQVGTGDLSVRREGGRVEVWMVMYTASERGPAVDSAAARVLDSFRLTGRPPVSAEPDSRAMLEWFGGRWGWSFHPEPCGADAATVTVAPDRKSARVEPGISPRKIGDTETLTFEVTGFANGYLRGGLIASEPFDPEKMWDVVRLSRDAFCWHRIDWEPSMCSAPVQRCPAVQASRTLTGDLYPPRRSSSRGDR